MIVARKQQMGELEIIQACCIEQSLKDLNPFMHNVQKWSDTL